MEQDKLLEEGEVMLDKVRKHWIVYVENVFVHIFGSLLFIGIAGYLSSKGVLSFLDFNVKAYTAMGLVALVLLGWVSLFYFWTKDYFDVWYVTDRHIIAVNQKEMFEREESFMELIKIQDVRFEKNGFIATFLGYGRLKVQTAGSDQEFVIEDVCDVEAATHRIMELRDKAQQGAVRV
jgi:hypothetical protein